MGAFVRVLLIRHWMPDNTPALMRPGTASRQDTQAAKCVDYLPEHSSVFSSKKVVEYLSPKHPRRECRSGESVVAFSSPCDDAPGWLVRPGQEKMARMCMPETAADKMDLSA